MTEKNYKQIMNEEWQNARKLYHYPQLPYPRLVSGEENGSINMENLEITVSEPFIDKLEEKGITSKESFNEILTHELTHFMKFPGSVLNTLRLQKAGQGIADESKINNLRHAFTEAQTNIYQLNELKSKTTAKVRKAYGLEEGDSFGKLMYGLYQEVSGQDLGIDFSKENLVDKVKDDSRNDKDLIEKLKTIDYTNKKKEIVNFRNFANILKDYEIAEDSNKGGMGEENQGGSGNGLKEFSDNQIREGLKQFAQECGTPEEYEEIVKQVLNDKGGKPAQMENSDEQKSFEKSAGVGKGVMEIAENFYTALAERYTIPVKKKQMKKSGSLYPYSHTSFEMGDSIMDVDAFSTPGILPGITKKWVRKEGESYGNDILVPDSFIMIDNSGSMPSPIGQTSIPVLGATAISNAYFHNGSKVAVYNFGGEDYLLQPTKNKNAVHKQLRVYTRGGTTFNTNLLESVLKGNEKQYDLSVVSDMEINNLDDFVEAVSNIPKTNRIHLFWTNPAKMSYVNHLKEKFGNMENIGILPLTNSDDIEKITMGELTKSVK